MIVYDLTLKVDRFAVAEWVEWMQERFLPAVMETELFEYCRVFEKQGDKRIGRTYLIQLYAQNVQRINTFLDYEEPELLKEQVEKFRGRIYVSKAYSEFIEEVRPQKV